MGCICPRGNTEESGGTSDYVEFGKYIGERNCFGQRNGKGQYFYDNGDMYDGMWKRNCKHGYGKYTYCSGEILEGFFENDEYLGELAPVEVCYDADKPLPTLGGISGTEEPIVRHVESKDERDKRRKGRELKIEEMRKKYGVAKA